MTVSRIFTTLIVSDVMIVYEVGYPYKLQNLIKGQLMMMKKKMRMQYRSTDTDFDGR